MFSPVLLDSDDIGGENLQVKSIDRRERTKTAKLSAAAIDLMREAAAHDRVRLGGLNAPDIARLVKAVPVRLTGVARAIGGTHAVPKSQSRGCWIARSSRAMTTMGFEQCGIRALETRHQDVDMIAAIEIFRNASKAGVSRHGERSNRDGRAQQFHGHHQCLQAPSPARRVPAHQCAERRSGAQGARTVRLAA